MELAYATILGLNVRVKSNPDMMRTNWHVSVSRVQIDNQLFTTPYPVLLRSNDGSNNNSETSNLSQTSTSSTFLDVKIEHDHRYVGLQFFESVVVRMMLLSCMFFQLHHSNIGTHESRGDQCRWNFTTVVASNDRKNSSRR